MGTRKPTCVSYKKTSCNATPPRSAATRPHTTRSWLCPGGRLRKKKQEAAALSTTAVKMKNPKRTTTTKKNLDANRHKYTRHARLVAYNMVNIIPNAMFLNKQSCLAFMLYNRWRFTKELLL